MCLKFELQGYQNHAIAGIAGLFHGAGDLARKYLRHDTMLLDSVGNTIPVSAEQIQQNLHAVQRRNGLPLTDDADKLSFCVEMETGTGKTYVYIKTIYELHERYGLSKFIVVVPSLAIREGVKKFFEMTHEHFQTHYAKMPIRWFVYNSSRLGDVREFAQSTGIEVMIINIDAFRKSENIIHQPLDRMNGGRAIDLISMVNPVVIIDEPQSVDNTPKAKEAVSWLNPLFILTILRNELRITKRTLLAILRQSGRIGDFLNNPERFLEEAAALLRESKAAMITDGIRYIKLAGEEYRKVARRRYAA